MTAKLIISDSASGWNQGIYLAPSHGSETISDAVGDEGETTMDFLPKKIKVNKIHFYFFE